MTQITGHSPKKRKTFMAAVRVVLLSCTGFFLLVIIYVATAVATRAVYSKGQVSVRELGVTEHDP